MLSHIGSEEASGAEYSLGVATYKYDRNRSASVAFQPVCIRCIGSLRPVWIVEVSCCSYRTMLVSVSAIVTGLCWSGV